MNFGILKEIKFYLVLLLFVSCSKNNQILIEGKYYEKNYMPNCIQVSENLYVDETEVANIDYKEYMYWTMFVYGIDSKEYNDLMPDTNVWKNYNELINYSNIYYRHPAYDTYPVVGINLEQAKKYSKWRTEIVTEIQLIEKGLIKQNRERTKENHFTIDRYVNGNFDWIIKKEDILIPKYSIPKKEEWELIVSQNYLSNSIDSTLNYNKKLLKKNIPFFNSIEKEKKEYKNYYPWKKATSSVRDHCKDKNGIYNLYGNVSELIDEEGIARGGNWKMNIEEIVLNKDEKITKPDYKTGFRNVCKWELIRIKNGN